MTKKSVEEFVFIGAYPGALAFIQDENRWRNYILHSIIDSIMSRDILMLTRVEKPALLRRLFQLGCEFSGQILSYQKALGQLQETSNTTTLAHYLKLLELAFVLSGLEKFELSKFRKRGSSPKFQVHNTALMGALGHYTFSEATQKPEIWGRYLESAVGAHLLNRSRIDNVEVYYWKDGNMEVDFILKKGEKILALEVKSQIRGKVSGLVEFKKKVPKAKTIVVSSAEFSSFLTTTAADWF